MSPRPPLTSVIFLHGFSGDHQGLACFADEYVGKQAVCIDLPGFGGSPAPSKQERQDIVAYAEMTWRKIRHIVPEGDVQLVGHSYGAMVAFVIACRHANDVSRLDLICPVAKMSLVTRIVNNTLHSTSRMGLAVPLKRFMASRFVVDQVSHYFFRPDWTDDMRNRVFEMRRSEAKYYTPVMFDLMRLGGEFIDKMDESYCDASTVIIHAVDDNVASEKDLEWYQQHCRRVNVIRTTGGHLCPVTEPEKIAHELQSVAMEKIAGATSVNA